MKKRIGKVPILCLTGAVLLFLLAEWMARTEDVGRQGRLPRNSYGEGMAVYELIGNSSGEEYPLTIQVEEQIYSPAMAETVLEQIFQRIRKEMLGDNQSLERVEHNLNLMSSMEKEGVKVRWSSGDPDFIDAFGQIRAEKLPESGTQVMLEVQLSTGEHSKTYEIPICLYPPTRSEQEMVTAEIEEKIREIDLRQQEEAFLQLPAEYEGRPLQYREKEGDQNEILLILGVAAAILCYAKEQMADEEKKKQYARELLLDYPDLIFKLKVFTGAGMTVTASWEKMVSDYQLRLEGGKTKPRAAYEEMKKTWGQIQCGVPEGQAFSEFGKRCRLQPYLKLSSLLEQNRKTGTRNFSSLLEAEMTGAWEERKSMAKRLSEEAGTKLLLPLFLMLGIVMVIVMVPAMLSII